MNFIERICEWYEVDDNDISTEELQVIWERTMKSSKNYDKNRYKFLDIIREEYGIPLEHLEEIWKDTEGSLTRTESFEPSIYIASMNMRGKWAERPENSLVLNVTSAQGKENKNRKTFSPMTHIEGGYRGFWCFENYWQSGKVYESIPFSESRKWWKQLQQPKRRYPPGKGKKVLFSNYDGEERDYIQSRKDIYVKEYYEYIRHSPILHEWKDLSKNHSIVIYDFDGPRDEGEPVCKKVDLDLLISKINDPTYPFGHGYVVAGALSGFEPEQYISI